MVDRALTHVRPEDSRRREELLKLKREIADIQSAVAAHERRMQNQMLKVPVEIYGEIFWFVMAGDHTQIMTLLHVCGLWRRIVWDTPGLWHTLVLSKPHTVKKAALWLERSNGRIQELRVLSTYTHEEWPSKPSFLDHIDWSHLRVCRIHSIVLTRYIEPRLMFRSLEDLEFDYPPVQNIGIFHPCAKLKLLTVRFTRLQPEHLGVAFPSLTSLSLDDCVFTEHLPYRFTPFLNANPQLESLSLRGVMPEQNRPVSTTPWGLENPPSLKYLTSLVASKSPWATFFLLLDIPMLQTLRIELVPLNPLNDNLTHWISTCPKYLTELSLHSVAVSKDILIRLLQTTYTIEILSLVRLFEVSNSIINALVEMEAFGEEEIGHSCLCPRLRHLDVSKCLDVETGTLHALVKQRLVLSVTGDDELVPRVNKLEVLKIDECPKIDVQWVPWFREHVPIVSCVYTTTKMKGFSARRM